MSFDSTSSSLPVVEGETAFDVASAGKPCKTWYKVVGDLFSGKRPLIALNGGPGSNSDYLFILSDITAAHSIPLILYDQIGTGLSTHLPEKMGDMTFWTIQLFLDELHNLLRHLKIQNYDLIGHSWGGILAASHAIQRPVGLKRLVLMSAPAALSLYRKEMPKLLSALPVGVREVIEKHATESVGDSKEYQDAAGVFYSRYLCSLNPMPKPILTGFQWMQKDPTVSRSVLGPTLFNWTGTLKDWTIVDDVHKINVPTLLTNGRMDYITDRCLYPFFKEIPQVKWVTFANSGHMAHFEERERFMEVLGGFLID